MSRYVALARRARGSNHLRTASPARRFAGPLFQKVKVLEHKKRLSVDLSMQHLGAPVQRRFWNAVFLASGRPAADLPSNWRDRKPGLFDGPLNLARIGAGLRHQGAVEPHGALKVPIGPAPRHL